MTAAHNLNLDCLELIFAHLHGNDLVSVSLVNRSFLAAVIPRLYRTLAFRLSQAKRYPGVISPFAAVLSHPNLAVHVRSIDLRTVPNVKSALHPGFMGECARTISLCKNLAWFICTPNVLPSFLLPLQEKASLNSIRINASLTSDQATKLVQIKGLQSLTLDSGSWNVVDVLPKWMASLQHSLTSLTLNSIHDLNEDILHSVVVHLPHLIGLHVVGCPKISYATVLRVVAHTPSLTSLAFTGLDNPRPLPPALPELHLLRHLAIDTQCTLGNAPNDATPCIWSPIIMLTRTWMCPLSTIALRLSDRAVISDNFVCELLDAHATTLTHITLINCSVTVAGMRMIASRCTQLERLAMTISSKEVKSFADALARSHSLRTFTDVEPHHAHKSRVTLTRENVRHMMDMVPNLNKIITDGRIWTANKSPDWMDEGFRLSLERRKNVSSTHWFMPP